jgi:hypothetical protein
MEKLHLKVFNPCNVLKCWAFFLIPNLSGPLEGGHEIIWHGGCLDKKEGFFLVSWGPRFSRTEALTCPWILYSCFEPFCK